MDRKGSNEHKNLPQHEILRAGHLNHTVQFYAGGESIRKRETSTFPARSALWNYLDKNNESYILRQ